MAEGNRRFNSEEASGAKVTAKAKTSMIIRSVFSLGMACGCTVFSQSRTATTASIAGVVRDENGTRVSYACVTISTQGFEQRRTALIDGSFQFTNLKAGPEHVLVCRRDQDATICRQRSQPSELPLVGE